MQSAGKRGPLTAKKRPAPVVGNNEVGGGSEERAKMVKSKKIRLLMMEPATTLSSSIESKLAPLKRTRRLAKSKCNICGVMFTHLDDLKWHKEMSHTVPRVATEVTESVRKSLRIQAKAKSKGDVGNDVSIVNDFESSEETDVSGKNDCIVKSKRSQAMLICDYCEYKCKMKGTMTKHIVSHHPNEEIDVNADLRENVLSCAICLRTFTHKANLRKHVSKHELNVDGNLVKSDQKPKRGYCCDICNQGFQNQRDMLAHRDVGHDTAAPLNWSNFCRCHVKLKYCDKCSKYFNDNKLFSCHECVKGDSEQVSQQIKLLLESVPSYKCDVCSLCFHWKWMYRSHRENVHHLVTATDMEITRTDIPFYCKSCLKAFDDNGELTKHIQGCAINPKNKHSEFKCTVCSKSFTRKSDFHRHVRTKHPDPEQFDVDEQTRRKKCEICCPYCNIQESTRNAILKHIKDTHDVEMDTPFACVSCNKVFKRKATLDMHKQIYHPAEENVEEINKIVKEAEFLLNGELAFHCNVCNRNLPSSKKFLAHYRLHNLERKFTCDLCGKQTRTQHQLNTHIKIIHLNIRNFECDICRKTFHSKQSCEEHRRIHTGERPFSCEICGKTFIAMNALFTHKKFHNDFFAHPCSMCPKKFKVRRSLINHIRTHTGERPYKCDICSKTFNNSSRFSYHKKVTHSDNRPFTCDQCGSCFKANKFLMRHMKLHSIRTHIQFRRRNNPAYFEKHDTNVKKKHLPDASLENPTQSTKGEADSCKSVDGLMSPIAYKYSIRIPYSEVENIQIQPGVDSVVDGRVLGHHNTKHFLDDAFTDNSNQNEFDAESTNDSASSDGKHMVCL